MLQKCFKTNRKLGDQGKSFEKENDNIFYQSFQKIKGTKRKKESQDIEFLFNDKKAVKA